MAIRHKSPAKERPTAAASQTPLPRAAAELTPEELRERLQSIRPRDDDAHSVQPLADYLTFWIAGEEYALPLARAREIVRTESITGVPDTPTWLRGVTNIRGAVIPVVDLAPRLGYSETPLGRRTAILLVEVDWTGDCMVLGLLVEAVGRVASTTLDAIKAAPPFGTRIRPNLLAGLIPVDDRFALILDADAALSPSELLPRAGTIEGAGDSGAPEAAERPAD